MAKQQAQDTSASGFVPVCSIGASAGGVEVLQNLFRLLPGDLGLAYVVVVHLSPDRPSALHAILAACTPMPVYQVQDGPILQANCVYVIAPDSELVIDGDHVRSRPFTDPRGHRAPIDMFFRSVAAARGDGIAVVLTGAGADGAVGVRAIKEAGGIVMVQEPSEAGFPSMPQHAIATGVADIVAPLARLAERIGTAACSKEAVRSLDEDGTANDLRLIIGFLRARTGHDFSGYKRATVMRRVMRRMVVCQTERLEDYARHLRATPEEAKALFADLLISVTMFFRDPSAYVALCRIAIRPVLDSISEGQGGDGFRAWVAGCATGEEAYSVAIVILEAAEELGVQIPVQIFATDLDEGALATAREGRYPRSIEADVSAERLRRFFVDEGTHYRIGRRVRDLVLFANHSVLREPPFMRLDLVSCRNVLIYLERALQQHVCSVFHYGLKSGRYLFLGSAETADTGRNQFSAVDRDARVYEANLVDATVVPVLTAPSQSDPNHPPAVELRLLPARFESAGILQANHVAALEASAPPSALVDADYTVLHLSPTAGRFILLSAGPLSGRLPTIVRPELRLDLGLALDRVFSTRQPTISRLIETRFENEIHRVLVHVVPVPTGEGAAPRALVYFLDSGLGRVADPEEGPPPQDELLHLHDALKAAQEAALAGRIGHEAALQELRASNEELQSLNEEYRSTAEELETSKEELQSINEELHTVNAELKNKLFVLSAAHDDLQNLTSSSEIGTLFLDGSLRIRMFTPRVADLINVTQADIGRPVTDFSHRLAYDGLERDVRQVLQDLAPSEQVVRGVDDRWFMVRLRPYRTFDGRIEGAVVTFDDITARHEAESRLRQSEERLRTFGEASQEALWVRDAGTFQWEYLTPAFETIYGLDRATALAGDNLMGWVELVVPEDRERALASLRRVRDGEWVTFEYRIRRPVDGSVRWLRDTDFPIRDDEGRVHRIGGVCRDITDLKAFEVALTHSEGRLRTLVEGVPHLVWRAIDSGDWTWASPQWTAYTGCTEPDSRRRGWLGTIHPEDRDRVTAAWNDARRTGGLELEYRIRRASDGTYRWFQNRATPLRDEAGKLLEWLGTSTDIDDLRRLQTGQALLVAELQHRTRNLIAVVQAIASDTLEETGPTGSFHLALSDRLSALSRVQELLSRSEAKPITIDTLVRLELDALGAGSFHERVTVVGSDVVLRSSSVQTLALALHELATNARKYGALSHERGHLEVRWREQTDDGETRLALEWIETGLEHAPARPALAGRDSGYGRELIEKALPHALDARTSYVLTASGVRCTIDVAVRSTA